MAVSQQELTNLVEMFVRTNKLKRKEKDMRKILLLVLAGLLIIGATFVFATDNNTTEEDKTESVKFNKSSKSGKSTKSIEEKLEAGLITEEQAEQLQNGVSMKEVFADGKITPEMLQWKVDNGYLTREEADQVIAGTADIGDFLPKYKNKK